MARNIISIVLTSLSFLFFDISTSATLGTYNVVDLGANPDGKTDCSKALLKAWDAACGSTTPATIYVPKGRFLVKQVKFNGPCKNVDIGFQIDGTLVAPSDYNVVGNSNYWIYFQSVNGVSIRGGVLDGQGSSLWACKSSAKNCPFGATTLGFWNSSNIELTGVTSLNSQLFHIAFLVCRNVKLQSVTISASGNSPNTDGIHVQLSTGVTIFNSKISTGDDCISIGHGTTNLWIENVNCGPGHGISIGSLGKDVQERGVQNVTVKSVAFMNTQNGVRIKTWGKPSNGFVKGVLFQHVTMINVQNPIVIDQHYCEDKYNCPTQESGVKISDVKYADIHGSSATQVAVKFDCSKKNPCSGIKLQDVKLKYKNLAANASCTYAAGTTMGLIEPTSCL